MAFHLGKPIVTMAMLSLAGGMWYALHRPPARADLALWVFAGSHFHEYRDVLREPFEKQFSRSLQVDLISTRAMDMRLPTLFVSPASSTEMPDAVEIEIQSIGRYLRPPPAEVGFLPLNHFLETRGFRQIDSPDAPGQDGWSARSRSDGAIYTHADGQWRINPNRQRPDAWIDRILPGRLATAEKDGVIFALPHDVHPVALAYRDDLFREAGIALADADGRPTCATWPQFHEKCLQFQRYWQSRGFKTRHAIELPESGAGKLFILLQQRRIALIDEHNRAHLNDPKVTSTLAFYAQMVAGEAKISGEATADSALEYQDLAEGNLCALLMPDWQAANIKRYVPLISGKLRLLPLPRFDPDDAPSASYGGTFIAITRASPHPEQAWELIEFLYLGKHGLADRQRVGIVPPLPETWADPEFQQRDPFFGGQKAMQLYTQLAGQAPAARVSPLTAMALGTLSYVQSRAVAYVRENGASGLEAHCQQWLDDASRDLQSRIDHTLFDDSIASSAAAPMNDTQRSALARDPRPPTP